MLFMTVCRGKGSIDVNAYSGSGDYCKLTRCDIRLALANLIYVHLAIYIFLRNLGFIVCRKGKP